MNLEVSCRIVQAILQRLAEQHQETERVFSCLPYSREYLANKNERITWDDFCRVVDRLKANWSESDFEALGNRVLRSRSFHGSMTTARLFFNASDLYLWINRNGTGPGSQLFSCVQSDPRLIGRNHIALTLRLTPGHRACPEFFFITIGAMKVVSTLIGLPPSVVDMTPIEDGASFDIRCPEGGGQIAWLRRALTWPKSLRIAATELRDANEALNERYGELAAARDTLARQATQLKVAYDISQLIRADLDLDATLDAIARSLVEVAGFAAAMVTMDATLSGQRMVRRAEAGHGAGGGGDHDTDTGSARATDRHRIPDPCRPRRSGRSGGTPGVHRPGDRHGDR